MKQTVNVTKVVDENIEAIWAVISAVGGVDKWLPEVIKSCRVEGEGEETKRFCEFADGSGELEETIVENDSSAKRFKYSIDKSPLPVIEFVGTIELRKISADQAEISWTAEFVPIDEESTNAVIDLAQQAYDLGIDNLAEYARNGSVKEKAA